MDNDSRLRGKIRLVTWRYTYPIDRHAMLVKY